MTLQHVLLLLLCYVARLMATPRMVEMAAMPAAVKIRRPQPPSPVPPTSSSFGSNRWMNERCKKTNKNIAITGIVYKV